MNETWLPIAGFEGLYEVSDIGRVKSLARVVSGTIGAITRRENWAWLESKSLEVLS